MSDKSQPAGEQQPNSSPAGKGGSKKPTFGGAARAAGRFATKGFKGIGKGGKGAVKGAAATVKGAVAFKTFFMNTIVWIIALVALILVIVVIAGLTVERTADHAKKYGCGSGEMNDDLISLLDPSSLYDIGKWFKDSDDDEAGCETGGGVGFTGEFYPPTPGYLGDGYQGEAPHRVNHTGQDMSHGGGRDSCGKPIFAYAGGEVTKVVMGMDGPAPLDGPFPPNQGSIRIKHEEGFETTYDHMKAAGTFVRAGDVVSAGDQIAEAWDSGWSIGCHLHFEVWVDGKQTSPKEHMRKTGILDLYPIVNLSDLPPKPEGKSKKEDKGDGTLPQSDLLSYAEKQLKSQGLNKKSELTCLVKLWNRESNWRWNAINPAFAPAEAPIPENQAYGIPQSGPGRKMAETGSDWKTNPKTQIRWGLTYIKGRYGTPCGAWAHSEAVNWY